MGHIERREAIRADCQTFTGCVAAYELHAYHLLAYHGNWYVLARNMVKDQIETFALSRFRRIASSGDTFTRPADFNVKTYARQPFWIGGETPIKVRLLFAPKLAVYITERQWHPTQEFRARADGRIEMRFETIWRKELWNVSCREVCRNWNYSFRTASPNRAASASPIRITPAPVAGTGRMRCVKRHRRFDGIKGAERDVERIESEMRGRGARNGCDEIIPYRGLF